jgi:hypothetical protein
VENWLPGRAWSVAVIRLAVAGVCVCALVAACGASSSPGTSNVTVLSPSHADVVQFESAFNQWELLSLNCFGQIVNGTVHIGRVRAGGVSWAVVTFRPPEGCVLYGAPAKPGGPPETIPPRRMRAWAPSGSREAVFERQPGQTWVMNSEASTPFPCPPPAGRPLGPGIGAVPTEVVEAWEMSYAKNCAFVLYAPTPRT